MISNLNQNSKDEQEILVVKTPPYGLSAMVLLTLLVNTLITGFIYRYHNAELIKNDTRHALVYQELQRKAQVLEEDIRILEGVTMWQETRFYKAR